MRYGAHTERACQTGSGRRQDVGPPPLNRGSIDEHSQHPPSETQCITGTLQHTVKVEELAWAIVDGLQLL